MKWGDCPSKDDLVTEPLSHSLNFRVLGPGGKPQEYSPVALPASREDRHLLPASSLPHAFGTYLLLLFLSWETRVSLRSHSGTLEFVLRSPGVQPQRDALSPGSRRAPLARLPRVPGSRSSLCSTLRRGAQNNGAKPSPAETVEPASFLPLRAQHRPRRRPLPWRRPSCIPGSWKSLFLSFCKSTFGPSRFQPSPPRGSRWSRAAGRQGATNCKLFGGGLGAGCRERCVVQ